MSNIRRTVAALLLTACAVGVAGVAAQADDGTQEPTVMTTPTAIPTAHPVPNVPTAGRHWDW